MTGKSVLFFTYWYPNKNNKNFGIFVKRHAHAISLSNKIVVLGFLFHKSNSFYKKKVEVVIDENKVVTHTISIESLFYKLIYFLLPWQYFIVKKHIKKQILPDFQFEVLHSNVLFPCAIVGHHLSKAFRIPHLITEHWNYLENFLNKNIYSFAGKITMNKAIAITSVSSFLKSNIMELTKNKNLFLVPNVIETKSFYYSQSDLKSKVLKFIAVAHWNPPKNPFYFLDALKELKQENKLLDFEVLLVGKGRQEKIIRSNKYPFTVLFKSDLSVEELRKEFCSSDIFVHGSELENFSVVIAEALSCGLPCVVSPKGIANEVITEINGFVTNNTLPDWKEKIYQAATTNYDRIAVSESIKNKYDLETVGKMFSEVYNSI